MRTWLAAETGDELWLSDLRESDVRLLVLVHRMAATRLGFPNLYAALNDNAPQSLSEGLGDGSAWPLRPFVQHILPMMTAARSNDHFTVMSIVRGASPRLESARLAGQMVSELLAALRAAVDQLVALMAPDSQASVGDIVRHVRDTGLLRLHDRFAPHLFTEPVDDGHSGFANVQAFLACGVAELWSYRRYIDEESLFATHHGVKGAQFERVLVVIDDEEAAYSLYSYGKYFGFLPLSDRDQAHIDAGEESVLDRTGRLFYVCCSRAVKDLAVVVFAQDVGAARAAIEGKSLFPEAAIRSVDALQ